MLAAKKNNKEIMKILTMAEKEIKINKGKVNIILVYYMNIVIHLLFLETRRD